MKIAHLILTSRFAGSERYAIELANAQVDRHEVIVILTRTGAEDRLDALAHRLDSRIKKIVVPNFLSHWFARRALLKIQPDVAHAHLSAGCKALAGIRAPFARVASLHIRYKPQQHAKLDGLIAIAPWQLADVPTPLRERTEQIDNWTQAFVFDSIARNTIRAQYGIKPNDFVFGALGRMEKNKGFDLLIAAFQKAALADTRLVIVGQGSQFKSLEKETSAQIVLPGFAAKPQDWLNAFDAFISPARNEPFGLVMLEAMQAGLPLRACATQGALHLASSIGSPLIPLNDVEALRQVLIELNNTRPARHSYDLSRFRIESALPKIENFYQSIMQQKKQPRE